MSIYAHVLPDMQGATARAMDLMLGADEYLTADNPPMLSVVHDPKDEGAACDVPDGAATTPSGHAQEDASESAKPEQSEAGFPPG
jgi:hypothetical protein